VVEGCAFFVRDLNGLIARRNGQAEKEARLPLLVLFHLCASSGCPLLLRLFDMQIQLFSVEDAQSSVCVSRLESQ